MSQDRDDDRWIAEVARHWTPAPLDEAERARFDAALGQRLEVRPRPATGPLAFATGVLAAAALAWLAWVGAGPGLSDEDTPAELAARVAWEWELLAGEGWAGGAAGDAFPDDELPREWEAMAQVFLGP